MATDAAAIVAAARGWIGTPYLHQASLKGIGCDCLGLLRGVFREIGGREIERPPPYTPDWADAKRAETLHDGLARHLNEIPVNHLVAGNVVLFRMISHAPAKHCGIIGAREGALSLIHARSRRCVNEEMFSVSWRRKLAYAFEVR